MITVISGTNRPGSNTLKVANLVTAELTVNGEESTLLDLGELPPSLFDPSSYMEKPQGFERFQQAVLDATGIITVIPEYNGSFPGVMKYFIDMLRFPESLVDQPVAFVGLSAGRWGALRSVEQLELVFQYRHAHLYGRRLLIPGIMSQLDDQDRLSDPELAERLRDLVKGFVAFTHALR